uniref:Allregulin n=1 Tax=Microcebus murinus TaxID=30608 RepID=A0A8C5XSB2_MICMU
MERGAAAAAAAAGEGRDGLRERRGLFEAERQQQNHEVQPQSGANGLPKHSYWLDLFFFIVMDLVLKLASYFL